MKINTRQLVSALGAAIGVLSAAIEGLADNPLISHRFTADPNAIVYDGRVYTPNGHKSREFR
jgi:hypothetical protein